MDDGLAAIAAHFAARRTALLERWRRAADLDPQLTAASVLSRAQFYDHIPEVLDAFERRLRARGAGRAARTAERDVAAGHGMHRWQQGYQQREVMREWRHLHLVLVDELEWFARGRGGVDPEALSAARRELAELCSEGVCESAEQYARLQRAEAAGRVRELERALAEIDALQVRRAEAWREAAHDLRGTLGVVRNAATALNHEAATPSSRTRSLDTLARGVESMHALLNDLVSLARLEAGHERRVVEPFDAAHLLAGLCDTMRPLAEANGLELAASGPDHLPVQGDSVKTYRIAQNLLVNAVRYTERGGISVSWEAETGGERWILCVKDTGPGVSARAAAPLVRALKAATDEALEAGTAAGEADAPPPLLRSRSSAAGEPPGEGIGLAIVKRLCELLDAAIELHTEPGKGTTFRVVFPRAYPGPLAAAAGGTGASR